MPGSVGKPGSIVSQRWHYFTFPDSLQLDSHASMDLSQINSRIIHLSFEKLLVKTIHMSLFILMILDKLFSIPSVVSFSVLPQCE